MAGRGICFAATIESVYSFEPGRFSTAKLPVTRNQHPAKFSQRKNTSFAVSSSRRIIIPDGVSEAEVGSAGRKVRLTNLEKEFWPELHIAKRDLLQYYA